MIYMTPVQEISYSSNPEYLMFTLIVSSALLIGHWRLQGGGHSMPKFDHERKSREIPTQIGKTKIKPPYELIPVYAHALATVYFDRIHTCQKSTLGFICQNS